MKNDCKIDTTDMPEPEILALKSTNRTVPVSLRVKESTYKFFLDVAEKYGSTASSVINELINTYAETNSNKLSADVDSEQDMENSDNTMISTGVVMNLCSVMRRRLDSFREMSDIELLALVLKLNDDNKKLSDEDANERAQVYLRQIQRDEANHRRYSFTLNNCPVWCSSDWMPKVHDGIIHVPSRDFPIIAAVVTVFIDERNRLMHRHDMSISDSFLMFLEGNIQRAYSRTGLINRLKMKFNPVASGIFPSDLL